MYLSDIHLRDPFILPYENMYYLYGTPGRFAWSDKASCLEAFTSRDLQNWDGPFCVFTPGKNFWADRNFWAPEVHLYGGRFYMFASFKSETKCRATQILAADSPLGPFVPLTDLPVTPKVWECLDGTLYIENGQPWIVYCHEWVQCCNGEMYAQKLTDDLRAVKGGPVLLFRAADAPWSESHRSCVKNGKTIPCYVTDGPFLRELPGGALCMIWSSHGKDGYALGQAISHSGICGPWEHLPLPVFGTDGGHGMIFDTFGGKTKLALHQPNCFPQERPVLFDVSTDENGISLC